MWSRIYKSIYVKLHKMDKEYIVLISYNMFTENHETGLIESDVRFGEEYLSLIKYIIKKAREEELSYNARILFRDGKIYLHISVPISLYTAFFSKGVAYGNNIASFNLNSDRVNIVIVDRQGVIRDFKTE